MNYTILDEVTVSFQHPQDLPHAEAKEVSDRLQAVGLTEVVRKIALKAVSKAGLEGKVRVTAVRTASTPAPTAGPPFTPTNRSEEAKSDPGSGRKARGRAARSR